MTVACADSRYPKDFTVIGSFSGSFGLSVAALNTLKALEARRILYDLLDIDGRTKTDLREHLGVNLFHVNPNEIRIAAASRRQELHMLQRLNVAVPFWELPHIPAVGWRDVLETMDVVLAPSRFVEAALREAMPGKPILHYPQAVFLPEDVTGDREAFGFEKESFVFYMSMDMSSDPARKNPYAVIDAFKSAFGQREKILLAIRVSKHDFSRATRRAYASLRGLVADDPRIRLYDAPMSYAQVLSLSASTDAYVSLHRSEGLGLNIMEAMSLGRPVIATGWSGNMDFTDGQNSVLVDYELVPVVATHKAYSPEVIGPDQVWAEPDREGAANAMRSLYTDREMAKGLGKTAASTMGELRLAFLRGTVFDELCALASDQDGPMDRPDRTRRLSTTLLDPWGARSKRFLGRTLRRLGLR